MTKKTILNSFALPLSRFISTKGANTQKDRKTEKKNDKKEGKNTERLQAKKTGSRSSEIKGWLPIAKLLHIKDGSRYQIIFGKIPNGL